MALVWSRAAPLLAPPNTIPRAETDGQVDAKTDGRVDAGTDGQVDAETDGQVDAETDADGQVDAETDDDLLEPNPPSGADLPEANSSSDKTAKPEYIIKTLTTTDFGSAANASTSALPPEWFPSTRCTLDGPDRATSSPVTPDGDGAGSHESETLSAGADDYTDATGDAADDSASEDTFEGGANSTAATLPYQPPPSPPPPAFYVDDA